MNRFPGNKRFAFSIFDDTDLSTVQNVGPVYRLLDEIGIHTTKSVWPLASSSNGRFGGSSLQDADYLAFVLGLKEAGFEIALHNVRNTCSTRGEIEAGLEEFRRLIGCYPRVHANHSHNRENIYWGPARFSTIAPVVSGGDNVGSSFLEGHIEDSKYFWGDLCRSRIDYVRNFVFREINLDRVNPSMPYHDPQRRFVNAWFSSSDGHDVQAFCELLTERQPGPTGRGTGCVHCLHPLRVRIRVQGSKRSASGLPAKTLLLERTAGSCQFQPCSIFSESSVRQARFPKLNSLAWNAIGSVIVS